ncbi:MAG: NUDIX hydrolase [Burkholderiaceae bacterium]|nr:NUDIX hydrolase [Burkholderiaceae bacterium]
MLQVWKPAVVVAAIIERAGRFLLVEEDTEDGIRYNQPAGHLEPGESLEQAVVRETLEETAHDFTPTALVGTYLMRFQNPQGDLLSTFIRFAFAGELGLQHDRPLDDGIRRTVWMTRDELAACRKLHRSPLTLQCIDDYLRGQRAPLSLLFTQTAIRGNIDE